MKAFSCPLKASAWSQKLRAGSRPTITLGPRLSVGRRGWESLGVSKGRESSKWAVPSRLAEECVRPGGLLGTAAGACRTTPASAPESVLLLWASGIPCFSPESARLTQGLSRPPLPHFQSSWGWRRLRDSPPGDTGRSTPRSSWPGVKVGLHSAQSQCSQAESPVPFLCLQPAGPFPGPCLTEGGKTRAPSWDAVRSGHRDLGLSVPQPNPHVLSSAPFLAVSWGPSSSPAHRRHWPCLHVFPGILLVEF